MESRPSLRFAVVALGAFAAITSTASCLLTSNFDGLTGNGTSSSGGGSTGSHASSSGGASAGGGSGNGGTSTRARGSGGSSVNTGGAGGAGGSGGCVQKNIGGAFPATCVLDDFNRPDGEPGLNWLIQNDGDYLIHNHQLVTPAPAMQGDVVRPGTTLWSAPLGATQEIFMTLSSFTADDGELEFLMKAQSTPMECGSIELSYHQGTLDVLYCNLSGGGFIEMPPGPASVTLQPGDQFGARATADGKVMVYQNGHRLGTWDSTGFEGYAMGGRIGFEMDGIVDVLAFDDFGGGGQ